jgi:asparagine synthase (glutamine-hydrolysing)
VLAPETVREGLARLAPQRRIAASLQPDPGSPIGRVTALESCHYMRNQLLRDADWAGMAHSLEIRTPLVDWTLLNTLSPLLPSLRRGEGKSLLAQAPSLPLDPQIVSRAKTGFGVPMGVWRAGAAPAAGGKGRESREWAGEILGRWTAPAPSPARTPAQPVAA